MSATASRPRSATTGKSPDNVGKLPRTVIQPESGIAGVDLGELADHRDLFRFMVLRDIRVRYAQSVLGIGWAIIPPIVMMGIYTVIFGNLVDVASDGVPYFLFSLAALVPWTYFSNAVTDGVASLVTNARMLSKIYFPRLVLPIAACLARLLDFGIALTLLFAFTWVFHGFSGPALLLLPIPIVLMILTAAGISMWLTALAVQYRDVRYGIPFALQVFMYATPLVYSVSEIPEAYRMFYALNPLVGVYEGFRTMVLGTGSIPWAYLGLGALTSIGLLVSGALYFRRMERHFADVA